MYRGNLFTALTLIYSSKRQVIFMCITFFVTGGWPKLMICVQFFPSILVKSKHTSCIPLLGWLTLCPHEVMRATRLSVLHMCKKSSLVEPRQRWCWVLFSCMMERADKDTGQHQLYGLSSTLSFCFSQWRSSLSQEHWPVITTLHPYMDFYGRSTMFPIHTANLI